MALTLSNDFERRRVRTEHELVAAARAGDDRAFEELYSRYRERILAFILSKVRDHGRAEDIAQEVFISALRRLRASDSEIAFKPWIYEIAKNACIDEFRRAQPRAVRCRSRPTTSSPAGAQAALLGRADARRRRSRASSAWTTCAERSAACRRTTTSCW